MMLNYRPSGLHFCLGILTTAIAAIAPAQSLFSVTEQANAGQPIVVTGGGFDGSTSLTLRKYATNGTLGSPISLTISKQTDMTLETAIPSTAGLGLYRVDSASASGAGGSIMVNMPRVTWVDLSSAAVGSTVRLFGRNFKPSGTISPTVRLVDTSTGVSISAPIVRSGDYEVAFQVPAAAVTGKTYRIFVNSNLAGSVTEIEAPNALTLKAAGTDPFNLGVPWGSEFVKIAQTVYNVKTDARLAIRAVGDGVADDTAAIQGAITYASQWGGGTVYLPAGTYKIDNGTKVQIWNRVVLKGDGDTTILRVGYRYNTTVAPSDQPAIQFSGGPNSGIANLMIKNVNGSTIPNVVFRAGGGDLINSFLSSVNFQLGNGKSVAMNRIRGGVVKGCTVQSTSMWDGPVNFNGAKDLLMTGNKVTWKCGRIRLCMNIRNVIENNIFKVDTTNYGTATAPMPETGAFETSFSQNLYIAGNQFEGYGDRSNKRECQMVMTQRSVIADYWAAGKVLSATPTTLVQAINWGGSWNTTNNSDIERSYVAITRGKGAGQIRRVKSHDLLSLTVDRPWDVVPDATSTYSVGSYSALDQVIVSNTMKNNEFSVMFYDGAVDCVVAQNQITDCGLIWLRASSQYDPRGNGLLSQGLLWNNVVRRNTITSTNTIAPTGVSLTAIVTKLVAAQLPMGSLALQNTITDNTITGSNFYRQAQYHRYDGIEVVNVQELGLPWDPFANLGYNIWNNTITGTPVPVRVP